MKASKRGLKRLALLLVLVMALTGLAACGGGSGGGGGSYDDGFAENVLRVTYTSEPESADPAVTTADYILMMNCLDTLVCTETNEDGENVTVPSLAKEWEISDDGLTYTMHLEQGVMFTNGEELTADDVLYTVDRMLDPARAGKNTVWMDMLAGAKDVLDGNATTVEGKGIIIQDDYNFQIVLEQPYAPFLSMLSVPAWSIMNREAGDIADEAGGGAATSKYGSDPEYFVGSGPFILKEWVLNDHVYLETNKDYWKGASELDGILIRIIPDAETEKMLFDQGQIDIFDLDHALDQIPTYKESEEWKDNIVEKTVLGTSYLSINEKIEPLNDAKVRQAIQMAIDRQTIIDSCYYGAAVPASGLFPEGLPGYNPDLAPIEYDPEGAKKLLAEAGYPDGFEMTLTQTTDSSVTDSAIDEVIAAQLGEVGIKVNIEQMDSATWYDVRATGELPMYRTSWTADFNDPDNFIYVFFNPTATVSRSFNYYNTEAMDRIEAARYMTDPEARMAEYTALEQLVIRDDAAMVPLWHKTKVRVVQDRVQNFVPMWAGYGDCSFYGVSLKTN